MDSQSTTLSVFYGFFSSLWILYRLYVPVPCAPDSGQCLKNSLTETPYPLLKLWVYSSSSESPYGSDLYLLLEINDFKLHESLATDVKVRTPIRLLNSKLFIHIFLAPVEGGRGENNPFSADWRVHQMETLKFCSSPQKPAADGHPVCVWRSHLRLNIMTDDVTFHSDAIPEDMTIYIQQLYANEYLPILIIDDASHGTEHLSVNNTNEMPLRIVYRPISYRAFCYWIKVKASFLSLTILGAFKEKDVNEMREFLFNSSLPFYLLLEFLGKCQLLFWLLAVEHDISYWKTRKTMNGLSTITVFWRCVSTVVLFLHRMDENFVALDIFIVIPAGILASIEIWKLMRIWLTERRMVSDNQALETQALNSQAKRYLSYVEFPLWSAVTIYTVMYNAPGSNSWYAYCVRIFANGFYSFGILYILPQVFINYKLKSVAGLPWNVVIYKGSGSLLNGINRFVFRMPIDDDGACYRDDVIFVIYLFQRWLYSANNVQKPLAKKIPVTGNGDVVPSSS